MTTKEEQLKKDMEKLQADLRKVAEDWERVGRNITKALTDFADACANIKIDTDLFDDD